MRLCFAMATNKEQGQSMNNYSFYLPQSVLSQGQLNVTLLTAGFPQKTKVMLMNMKGTQGNIENYNR